MSFAQITALGIPRSCSSSAARRPGPVSIRGTVVTSTTSIPSSCAVSRTPLARAVICGAPIDPTQAIVR